MKKQNSQTFVYDTAVIGGGIAGISASLAAARAGAKVILIEKQCLLGGLATSGLISIYLPLCDGCGHQVSYGIAEELLRLSIVHGAQRKYPQAWLENGTLEDKKKQRFEVQFNPADFALLAEKLLIDSGVTILYDTQVIGAVCTSDVIDDLTLIQDGQTYQLKAQAYIDCTGSSIVFKMAGAKTREYGRGNTLAAWHYYSENGLHLKMLGTVENSGYLDADRHAEKPLSNNRYRQSDPIETTRFLIDSHQMTLSEVSKQIRQDHGYELAVLPTMPEIRMTSCMIGRQVLKLEDYSSHFTDSIGMIADWRRRGFVYEVPFSCMIDCNIRNLIAAGRDISVDDEMWDVSRVIPACAVTGEAAGTAAVLGPDFLSVDIHQLQQKLKQNGQRLFLSEIDGLVENSAS